MIRPVNALSRDAAEVDAAAVGLRRTLPARPEAAFEEVETARLAAERMRARGFAVRTGLAKTGVSAVLDTGRPGRTVLLRADLDALPVAEKTGLAFASTTGWMHACGHDGHVAALDAAADLLLLDPPARGRVVFAFPPAEAGAGGAAEMIRAGGLDDPRPPSPRAASPPPAPAATRPPRPRHPTPTSPRRTSSRRSRPSSRAASRRSSPRSSP